MAEKQFTLGVSKEIPQDEMQDVLFQTGVEFEFEIDDVVQQQSTFEEMDEYLRDEYGYVLDEEREVYVLKEKATK